MAKWIGDEKRIKFSLIIFIPLFLLFLGFLFQTSAQARREKKSYDVVIVGGGLAGLSAAHELKGFESLILEKEDHVGSRILTQTRSDAFYDLGAVFRYDNLATLPAGNHIPNHHVEGGDIAVRYKGGNFYCKNAMDCVFQLGLAPEELKKLISFKEGPCLDSSSYSFSLSQESYRLLNSLFKVIHPGDISDYACRGQNVAFQRWPVEYYSPGNRLVVDALRKSLSTKIELNAEVILVEDYGKHVLVTYRQRGQIKKVFAKAVIVTTPAPIAKRILARIDPGCLSFLDSVKYGSSTVVAVGLKNVDLNRFSYLITPDFPISLVIQKRLEDKKTTVLLVYYEDKESERLQGDSDAMIVKRTIEIIHKLDMGNFTDKDILFADIKRWEVGRTIISDSLLRKDLAGDYSRPSKRVFLAGDYTYKNYFFPHGMMPAILSGKEAAYKAIKLLKTMEDSSQSCYEVDGISMQGIPNQKSIEYLSKIRPAIFGLVNFRGLKWLESLDQRKVFGYDFFKFYGSNLFSHLIKAAPLIQNTNIVGYCPDDPNLTQEEFVRNIQSLRKSFPDKKILIGPCVGLFSKVNQLDKFPDILGFEIFQNNFDDYINGKYDKLIKETLSHRLDVFIFITLWEEVIDFGRLEKVLKKAKSQQLKIGYTFNGYEGLFEFLLKHHC